MKTLTKLFAFLMLATFVFSSCQKTPQEKTEILVSEFLKANLRNPETYKPISFSKLDTIYSKNFDESTGSGIDEREFVISKTGDTIKIPKCFAIEHKYSITNNSGDVVNVKKYFYINKNFTSFDSKSDSSKNDINGDYATITGDVFWEYNKFVGNRADVGSKVFLYSLDSLNNKKVYDTNVDLNGYFKIEKIPPGNYSLIVYSENTTDCPFDHYFVLQRLENIYTGFDFREKYKKEITDIDTILNRLEIRGYNKNDYISYHKKIELLLEKFSKDLIKSGGLLRFYGPYSYKFYEQWIYLEDGEIEKVIVDFGNTCI